MRQHHGIGSRRGFTLVELMITVAVVALMLLPATLIVTYASKMVNASQANMRSNAQAAAMTRRLRADIRSASQKGFLCITQPSAGAPPQMLVTAPHVAYTVSGVARYGATGSVTGYGMCSDSTADRVFWRANWICNENAVNGIDVYRVNGRLMELGEVEGWPAATIGAALADNQATLAPRTLRLPVQDIDDVRKCWQVLSGECSRLEIEWTRGDRDSDGNLKWFGVRGNAPAWAGDNTCEVGINGGVYKAVWTNDNMNNWPLAVRFRFTLEDVLSPGYPRQYEVICPLGQ